MLDFVERHDWFWVVVASCNVFGLKRMEESVVVGNLLLLWRIVFSSFVRRSSKEERMLEKK